MLLTPDAFARARQFIHEQGRSLEKARFHHHFQGQAAAHVVAELAAFQNPDGGFGHGLEPDVRTPKSSAICTSIALQVARSLHLPASHFLVTGGMQYLRRTLNPDTLHWRIIPPTTDQSPHAPWWGNSADASYDEFELNPTAEILGYFYDYPAFAEAAWLEPLAAKVEQTVLALDTIEMHDLLCCLRLVQTPSLPAACKTAIATQLSTLIPQTVEQNPDRWADYGLRPLQVIDAPDSPFKTGLETAVEANLDYEIATQSASGAWEPTWSWGDEYPAVWAIARQEWSGVLTFDRLVTLQRFGRIAAGQQ